MPLIFVLLLIFFTILIVGGLFAFFHVRNLWREQKNYERGLKMVPLLIHLPPPSSDVEVGSRDERDVFDETISKAETLYDIISVTVQKGFKSKLYGQRHFAFEIVGIKGFVHFYTAVPVALLEVVEQAIISSYPTARLEEVAEHNLFSPVGKSNATMGGELVLKEDSSYPIATFHELKRDTMQSILNALSTLDKEDGAGIQILMRPAHADWRKNALSVASKKRDGGSSKKGFGGNIGGWFSQILYAPIKPPEDKKDDKKSNDKPLSSVEQSLIEGIESKTQHSGYEVSIRVVASSNVSQRAHSILNSIVATFALFDSPGKNGFRYVPAKDIDSFITSYILRFFPPEKNKMILNSIELATIFHFPDQNSIPTTQLSRQASKQVDGPRNVPDDGLVLGYNVFRGSKKRITLSPDDRRRHVYFVGQTGVGKTTFLQNLALQDMLNGDGFAFIDPHGDVADELLSIVPKERTEDVIYFCPSDTDYPLGLNMFEFDPERPEQKDFLIQESLNMLYKLYDPQKQGIIGPRFERIFTNAALLLMSDPKGGTFVDIPKLLIDPEFMKEKLPHVTDQNVLDFWTKEWPNSQKSNEAGEVTSWVVSKFGAFLSNEMMRNIIGQTKSSFNLREVMDKKKILIVNLSKGKTGELNSKLLGMIFVMKFQAAAMSRADVDKGQRTDFCLYVDEFQNYSTDSFADIMSEARKFGLNLIVANQFTTQLSDEVRDAVFGNIGTVVALRVGIADAEFLAKQFAPSFDTDDLQRIPNGNAAVRTMIHGVPTQPFSMAGLPPVNVENKELADALKQLSAAKYGRPRNIIDKEITERLRTKNSARGGGPGAIGPAQPKRPSTGSSFLDDWMKKRDDNSFKTPASPFKQQHQQQPTPRQNNVSAPPTGVRVPSAQQVSMLQSLNTNPPAQGGPAHQPLTQPVLQPQQHTQQPQPSPVTPAPQTSFNPPKDTQPPLFTQMTNAHQAENQATVSVPAPIKTLEPNQYLQNDQPTAKVVDTKSDKTNHKTNHAKQKPVLKFQDITPPKNLSTEGALHKINSDDSHGAEHVVHIR